MPSSVILLLVALVLLWLAVTDRLARLLDAVDVLRGTSTATASTTTASGQPVVAAPAVALHLPSLPALGQSVHVGIQ